LVSSRARGKKIHLLHADQISWPKPLRPAMNPALIFAAAMQYF
jgi:hypothetical protein